MRLRETAFRDPGSYFHRYSLIDDAEALKIADNLWTTINLVNLRENIFPTRPRADLVFAQGRWSCHHNRHVAQTLSGTENGYKQKAARGLPFCFDDCLPRPRVTGPDWLPA